MDRSIKLLGIAGSLGAASRNRAALEAMRALVPADAVLARFDLAEVPLYNPDLDGQTSPDAVAKLKAAITEADALILATPEYNYGMSGVMKNAIDWASRPAFRSPLAG
ncbi:MAG: NADPH-dependent FMN reductase [Rhodothalassiaceae bacterium]